MGQIMGGLLPIKLKNYNGWSPVLPDNSSFLFFFEKDKIKKCSQKDGKAALYSNSSYCFIGFGQHNTDLDLGLIKNKLSCIA